MSSSRRNSSWSSEGTLTSIHVQSSPSADAAIFPAIGQRKSKLWLTVIRRTPFDRLLESAADPCRLYLNVEVGGRCRQLPPRSGHSRKESGKVEQSNAFHTRQLSICAQFLTACGGRGSATEHAPRTSTTTNRSHRQGSICAAFIDSR